MKHIKHITLIVILATVFVLTSLIFSPSNITTPINLNNIAQAAPDDGASSGDTDENNGDSNDDSNSEDGATTDSNNEQEPSQADTKALIDKANEDRDKLTEDEEKQIEAQKKQGKIKETGSKYELGKANTADGSFWTLYSQILMDSKESKSKKDDKGGNPVTSTIKNSIGEFMGDGGVSINIPYNKMYSIGVDLDDAKKKSEDVNTQAGRQLASYFSTFAHYGYFNTVSGNKLAAEASGTMSTIARGIAGFVMIVTTLFYELFNTILGGAVNLISKLDILSLMGFGDVDQFTRNTDNPFTKAIYGFVQGLGINPHLFKTMALITLYIIVALFVWRIMRTLSNEAFHFTKIGDHTKRFIVRFLVLFPIPMIVITLVSGFASQLSDINSDPKYNPSPPEQYILNVRKWASALNLSPNGLQGSTLPNAGSQNQHIDGSFAPSSSRDLISNINNEAYTRMDNDATAKSIGFDLIFGYMQNNTFNVNTYMADIRQTPANGGNQSAESAYAAYKNYKSLDKKIKPQTYEDFIWTAKPVTSSNAKDAKPTSKKYQSNSKAGVENDDSFSTQTVALMLQTSFENNAANFYAYNIPPQGLQGQAKNMSTVKTEWREYTLPGEGILGTAGSYLALITQSIFQALVIFACIHALIFTNFFKSALLTFKHWGLAFATANPIHMMIALILGLTSPLTGFVAYMLPSLLISMVNTIASGMNGVVQALGIQGADGVIDLGKSATFLFLGFYLVIAKTFTGTNFITTAIDFPTQMGLDLAKKASRILRSRQSMRHAIRFAGQTARQTGQTSSSNLADSLSKGTFGQTFNSMRNPSDWKSQGAAYLKNGSVSDSNVDGNNQVEGQSAKDFAASIANGTNGVDGRNGINGDNGTHGANGSDGANGSSGANGSNGHTINTGATTIPVSGTPASNVTGNSGRTGTARNTLLGQTNPNGSSQINNPYGGKDYFAQAPVGSPAHILYRNNQGTNNQNLNNNNSNQTNDSTDPKEAENRERNNVFRNNASQLPSAMKRGTAKDFAQDINKEKAEKLKEAQQNGEQQGKVDVKNAAAAAGIQNNNQGNNNQGNNQQNNSQIPTNQGNKKDNPANRQQGNFNRDNDVTNQVDKLHNDEINKASTESKGKQNLGTETAKDFASQQGQSTNDGKASQEVKEIKNQNSSSFDTPSNDNQSNPTFVTSTDNKADNPANHDQKGTYNQQNMESGVASKIDDSQQNVSTPSYSGDKPTQDTAKDFASQQPAFTDKEISSLNKAKDEEDFQEKLYFTNSGQYTALSQDSAKQALANTEFVNDKGDVDYNKIDEFNEDINGKHLEDLDNARMKQKEQIDFAFRKGASSIYEQTQNVDELDKD